MLARILPEQQARPVTFLDHVLIYLCAAEVAEHDSLYIDDYRLARMTVGYTARGIPDPWRFAFWMYFGKVPEKLIPLFISCAAGHLEMQMGGGAGIAVAERRGKNRHPAALSTLTGSATGDSEGKAA